MLRRIRIFLGLSAVEKALLTRAFFWVGLLRLALFALPFQRILRLTERMPPSQSHQVKDDEEWVQKVAWAVTVAGRWIVPDRPCLTQALAARIILRRRGVDTILRIGVKKEDRQLAAHAWLEKGGRVIVGGERSPNLYVPFKRPIQS